MSPYAFSSALISIRIHRKEPIVGTYLSPSKTKEPQPMPSRVSAEVLFGRIRCDVAAIFEKLLQYRSDYDKIKIEVITLECVGVRLKQIRLQKGLSLKDVYKATGISDSKLSRVENGTLSSDVAPSILKTLSKLYDINLIDLYIDAGYLDEEALSSYEKVFLRVDLLSNDERNHIQEQIDLFTRGRK